MRHTGTQELETNRLLLRCLLPEDAAMMYQNWDTSLQTIQNKY